MEAVDIEGIDEGVMYGTRGRQILCHDDLAPDYAAALARAYNDWAADYCKTDPTRLKFAPQIAMHNGPSARALSRHPGPQPGAGAEHSPPHPGQRQPLPDQY